MPEVTQLRGPEMQTEVLTPEHFLSHSRKKMALTPQQRSLP